MRRLRTGERYVKSKRAPWNAPCNGSEQEWADEHVRERCYLVCCIWNVGVVVFQPMRSRSDAKMIFEEQPEESRRAGEKRKGGGRD